MGGRCSGSGGCRDSRSFSFHPAERFEGDEAARRERCPPPLLGQKRLKCLLPAAAPQHPPLPGLGQEERRDAALAADLAAGDPSLARGSGPSSLSVRPSPPRARVAAGGQSPPKGAPRGARHGGSGGASLLRYPSPIGSRDLFLPVPPPLPLKLPPLSEHRARAAGRERRLGPRAPLWGCRGAPALAGEVPPRPPPRAAAAAAEPRQGDYEDVSRSGGRREGRRAPDEVLGEPRRVIHVRPCVCV